MIPVLLLLCVLLAATVSTSTWLFIERQRLRLRYGSIIDVDAEASRRKIEYKLVEQQLREDAALLLRDNAELKTKYLASKEIYDRLAHEVSLLEQNADDISFGIYKPFFDFASSDDYKAQLTALREKQKRMVRDEQAVTCGVSWTVGDSRREGERMQKQYAKLLLRAFNGESDAASARVAWNNVTRMEQRIRHGFETINKLGSVMQIAITPGYLDTKVAELRLEYELAQKKHDEVEEQREIRERLRDEEKAKQEFEREQKEAEDEEARYQRALEKANKQLEKAHGEEVAALNERIKLIQENLLEAQKKKERAISLAQQTRAGHVYVISNVGSFGESVFKIGMTRRLDPMERVRELGGASVPFDFDVHAMLFSEDAPSLEHALHKNFAERRVNLVNHRREFFHVALTDLEQYAIKAGVKMTLTKAAEARQYRESLALRSKAAIRGAGQELRTMAAVETAFPQSI